MYRDKGTGSSLIGQKSPITVIIVAAVVGGVVVVAIIVVVIVVTVVVIIIVVVGLSFSLKRNIDLIQ